MADDDRWYSAAFCILPLCKYVGEIRKETEPEKPLRMERHRSDLTRLQVGEPSFMAQSVKDPELLWFSGELVGLPAVGDCINC